MSRKQLATWELLQYDADVVCLQEVARDVYDGYDVEPSYPPTMQVRLSLVMGSPLIGGFWFRRYLEPQLKRGGLKGTFMNKISGSNIGCAVFYKSASLDLVSEQCVDLTQVLLFSAGTR